jgi:hypothetical protein
MDDLTFVDLDGRKAVRISEVAKDRCLLLYHDKVKNVFRLGLFDIERGEYKPLTTEPRQISDTDPLAETARKLAKEIGEEFHGALVVSTPAPKLKPGAKSKTTETTPRKSRTPSKTGTVRVTKITSLD